MTYIGYFGTALMIVAGFCGLNEILFAVSSEFGMPTTIGGLGWALDHVALGSPVFQALGTAAGFVLSFLYDPNNETGAKFRTDRAKVVALEKMERIGDGARVTVGSPARDRASKRRVVRISAPKPAPAIRQNDAGEKIPA